MAEPLTLEYVASHEFTRSDGGKGVRFTAFFKEGRRASFWDTKLLQILNDQCKGIACGYELVAAKDPKYDPDLKRVESVDGTVLWDGKTSGGGGGGRPMLTDQQVDRLSEALRFIGEAIIALANQTPVRGDATPERAQETTDAEAVAGAESEMVVDAEDQAHPRCDKAYQGRRCVLVAGHWSDHEWEKEAS